MTASPQPKRRGRPPLPPEQRKPGRVKFDLRLLPEDKLLMQQLGVPWLEQQLQREREKQPA